MPPPHLHPRSRMTSSLFATTVVASFLVVALPHLLPCPAPQRRTYYADDGGVMPSSPGAADAADSTTTTGVRRTRVRRVRRVVVEEGQGRGGGEEEEENGGGVGIVEFRPGAGAGAGAGAGEGDGIAGRRRVRGEKRECPVPKPGGILGEWLGFNATTGKGEGERKTRPDR
ncbi:hypothetical protein C8A00DRAFT_41635 [Chaetomidium leptoderma]|uniref:Uncharacterized protein n=1 Tax=Chaetomidium leptoderma TaxID=669021 RepID=A0AAN6VR10_9PEZI|nr:hypothetical protein C8A00DRAFT_41635 [Chaetomidium leptoderma]